MNLGIDVGVGFESSLNIGGFGGVSKPTMESVLSKVPSGIGIDTSKGHTGVFIWDGSNIETYGFKLRNIDKEDPHWEYRLRSDFRSNLLKIVNGRYFCNCVVEDVYGGENFDTTRKLLALGNVVDELIFDGVFEVDNFYRWLKSEWGSRLRKIYKPAMKLVSKVETQTILEYLDFDFLLQNKDKQSSYLKNIFYEDICDAGGMLLASVVENSGYLYDKSNKSSVVKFKDLKLLYVDDIESTDHITDINVSNYGYEEAYLGSKTLKRDILRTVNNNPSMIYCAYVPVTQLGMFGIENNLKFFTAEDGYLIFYSRKHVK